jgi:vacuolar-type H+-ATPase subunit D/Vma8
MQADSETELAELKKQAEDLTQLIRRVQRRIDDLDRK